MKIRILDADPEKAARSLITPHVSVAINALRYTFAAIRNSQMYRHYYNRFIHEVKYSAENYVWFSEFYECLTNLRKTEVSTIKEFNESLLYDCSGVKFKRSGLNLFPDSKLPLMDQITANRAEYVKKGFDIKLFPVGVPDWYIDLNKIIYEKYDSKLDKGFRITQSKKGLKYFTAEYFNQWIEIVNVPKEMEELIKHLVYRK